MAITIEEMGYALSKAKNLNNEKRALCLLWWHSQNQKPDSIKASFLAAQIQELSLGNPNPTILKKSLSTSKFTISSNGGYKLKIDKFQEVESWFRPYLDSPTAVIDQDNGFLPAAVWRDTRPYIEKVCEQANGCFQYGFYDAAQVMIRRLLETLIIEAYSKQGRDSEIKVCEEYVMLGDLIKRSVGQNGLALGREAKRGLQNIKTLGDRSAHNRYFVACKADLKKIEYDVRVTVEELVVISGVRSSR